MKIVALTVAGAVAGGLVGAWGILCPDGSCVITGSWFGGGTVGGLLGYAAAGLLPVRIDRSTDAEAGVEPRAETEAPGGPADRGTTGDAGPGDDARADRGV